MTDLLLNEVGALYDIYNNTNGPQWTLSPNSNVWNFADPRPCVPGSEWHGLTCYCIPSLYCVVVSIDLSFTNLHGRIPTTIGTFSNLRQLDLEANQLHHTIPSEIGSLLLLEHCSLYDNHITGTIPSELGQLLSLRFLTLGGSFDGSNFGDLNLNFNVEASLMSGCPPIWVSLRI